ncbi:MAG: hypothetical protein OXL36_12710 [Bryobacterales bacterium]|nr:hypothetical protein [Bryobacterales bacterium]MDE0295907.1 hypothetical protein [Bryobacterales bacterium]
MQVKLPRRQTFLSRANQATINGFHESRNTRHESRPFPRAPAVK